LNNDPPDQNSFATLRHENLSLKRPGRKEYIIGTFGHQRQQAEQQEEYD
jgi:hypothetical protein